MMMDFGICQKFIFLSLAKINASFEKKIHDKIWLSGLQRADTSHLSFKTDFWKVVKTWDGN